MRVPALAVIAALSASPVTAQELRPLNDLLDDAASAYAPTRCAGLYHAMMEWAGAERLGEATWNLTDAHRLNFIHLAALVSQSQSGGTFQAQAENVARDVRNIADVYLERFESNYALQGQAFGADPLIQSDFELCGNFAGSLQ
jgi:hypothetical protein